MTSLPRSLPTGRCNFRNLNVKTTDYNTHCGCQTFWLDEGAAQEQTFGVTSLSSSSSSSASVSEAVKEGEVEAQSSSIATGKRRIANKPRPQQLCICGHHVCFHSLRDDAPSISDRQRHPSEVGHRTPSKQPEHNALVNLSKTFDDRAALSRQGEGFNFVSNVGAFDSSEWRAMGLVPGPISNTDGLGLSFSALENANYNANQSNDGRKNDGYTGYSSKRDGTGGNLTSEGTLQVGVAAPSPVPSSSVTEVATNLSFTPAQQYQPHTSIGGSTYSNHPNNHTSSPLQRAVQQRLVTNTTGLPQQHHYSPQQPQHQQLQDLALPQNRRQNQHQHNIQQPQPQPLHRMTPLVFQETATGTPTVVDSPLITNAGLYNLTQQAMDALRTLNEISMSLLPQYLQQRHNSVHQVSAAPSPHAADPTPLLLMEAVSPETHVAEEVTRKAMAAEGATKDLLQCLERSRSQVHSDSPHNVTPPQRSSSSVQGSSSVTRSRPLPSSPPPPRLAPAATPLSAKSAVSNGSMFASIPPPRLEQAETSLRAQLQLLKEKCEGLEDAIEDAANKAELAEDRVVDMEGRIVNVEDKVDGVAESFSRHKEVSSSSSLGKRSREDNHDLYESHVSKHKRDSKRRRRQKGTADGEEAEHVTKTEKPRSKESGKEKERSSVEKPPSSDPPEASVKQVTTTTRTSFTTSTCTSFTSNASGDSGMSYRTERLLSNLLTQITSLNARMSALEDLAPPTPNRPWVIEVVVLPPSTWASWKRQDGNLVLKSHAPRALHTGSKAWRRLLSRGLIKTVEVVGGEARDVERAIRKNFGGVFRALPDSQSLHSPDVSYEWSPLRKAPKQSNLRFLRATEMEHGFWKSDFLKRTCATEIFPPQPHYPPGSTIGAHDTGSTQSHTLQASSSNPRSSESTRRSKKWPTHRLWVTNCWTGAFSGAGSWDEMSDYTQVSSRASVAPPALRRRASSVASTQKSAAGSLRRRRPGGVPNDEESSVPISQTPFVFGHNDTGELGGGWDEVRRLPRYLDDSSDSPSARRTGASSHTFATGDHGGHESYWEFDETLDGPAIVHSSEDNTSFTGSSSRVGVIPASSSDNPISNSSSLNSYKGVSLRRRASKSSAQLREDQGNTSHISHGLSENFISQEGYFASAALTDESPLRREVPEEDPDADDSGGITPRAYSAPTPRARSPANWRLSQLSLTRPGSYPIGSQYMRRFARLRNPELPQNLSSEGTTNSRGLISSEVSKLTDFSTDEGVGEDEEADNVAGVNDEDGDDEEARMRASRSPTEEV